MKSRPIGIGEALSTFLNRQGLSSILLEQKLRENWPLFVGERVAPMVELESLKEGRLRLRVKHPAWRMDLHYQKEQLRKRANEILGGGAVKQVDLF